MNNKRVLRWQWNYPIHPFDVLKESHVFQFGNIEDFTKISPFSQLSNHPGKCLIAKWLLMMNRNLPTFICLFHCAAEFHPPCTVLKAVCTSTHLNTWRRQYVGCFIPSADSPWLWTLTQSCRENSWDLIKILAILFNVWVSRQIVEL